MSFKKLLIVLHMIIFGFSFANAPEANQEGGKEEVYNPVPFIMHHIADAHNWHLWGEGENSVGISLPVILWDNGLKVFSSANFSGLVCKSLNSFFRVLHR